LWVKKSTLCRVNAVLMLDNGGENFQCSFGVAEPHPFYAAPGPAPGKNLDAYLAAQASTIAK
jgi:hypothetical protein